QGLRQAERNTEDGMSFIQVAEGFMDQTANILQRIRVLAIQSANGIYTPDDRQLVQVEVSGLVDEIDRMASQAEFNRFKVLNGNYAKGSKIASMWFQMGANQNQRERVYIGTMTAQALRMKATGKAISISTPGKSNEAIGLVDSALTKLGKNRADLGAYYNRLEGAAKGLMNAYENVQASESRIRDADMAETFVEHTRNKILMEASVAMVSQASVRGEAVLRLLRS
ncbi:MAG: flagellin, partial [Leptospira sp.]|nr:flagellin [Leptospira sp.]